MFQAIRSKDEKQRLLCEIDVERMLLRFKKGEEYELVDLSEYLVSPVQPDSRNHSAAKNRTFQPFNLAG